MLKVTYIDFRPIGAPERSGWYITDMNGEIVGDGRFYVDEASGLRALMALS